MDFLHELSNKVTKCSYPNREEAAGVVTRLVCAYFRSEWRKSDPTRAATGVCFRYLCTNVGL